MISPQLASTNPVIQSLNTAIPLVDPRMSVTSITLGNGQGEFSLDPNPVLLVSTQDSTLDVYLNVNTQQFNTTNTDISISLKQLLETFPNLNHVIIPIAWYCNNLICNNISVFPGVITNVMETSPYDWNVAGLSRSEAYLISTLDSGLPAYGGTPSDQSLLNLLAVLSSYGLSFSIQLQLLMDIPEFNTLTNPYTDNASGVGQDSYPSSNLITVSPAKGFAGSVWGTSDAHNDIVGFIGFGVLANVIVATQNNYSISIINGVTTTIANPGITYNYTNFIMYYASLLSNFLQAYNSLTMESFYVGSNLAGLTSVNGTNAADYTAVSQLTSLVQASQQFLTPYGVGVSYAANWNEWSGTQNETTPTLSAPASFVFNMDKLWNQCDFIAINANFPISDWRNNAISNIDSHLFDNVYNQNYLVQGLLGQEYYDWYYADSSDSDNQIRTPILGPSGASDAWIYQYKNIYAWLNNSHTWYVGGAYTTSSPWIPNSKDVKLINIVCPTVDAATNQPDAFMLNQSTDYALPYYSNGNLDDKILNVFLSVFQTFYGYISSAIVQTSFGVWDSRPYPWYPKLTTRWQDTLDYTLGSTLNNKLTVVDTTITYNQFVDYDKLLTESRANNSFWVTLADAMGQQWNTLFHNAVDQLAKVRDVNVIEDELKASNVRQMGLAVPNYGLQYFQYDGLMRYLGTYYQTRGNSEKFLDFISFISNVPFTYIPLYVNNLNLNSLSFFHGTLVQDGGTWAPTPYYYVSYNVTDYPNLNIEVYSELFKNLEPIYLVYKGFITIESITAKPIYASAAVGYSNSHEYFVSSNPP